jgi:L-amino acid N-acyltransferase YncA
MITVQFTKKKSPHIITIKIADNKDLLDLFLWRNDPISRKMSINDDIVNLDEHKKWYNNSLRSPFRKIYIGTLKKKKVGMCRFDSNKSMTSAEVSINLNPAMRDKNLSYDLLSNSIKIFKKNNESKLTAIIKKENKSSLKIFKKCSFFIVKERYKIYYLKKY